jgi:hypothetical protein
MEGWFLDVPKVKGADLVKAGKWLWFVIEAPTYEQNPDGKAKLVAKAAMIFDEIFPQ